MFDTEKEFQLKVVRLDRLSPYGFLASELRPGGRRNKQRNVSGTRCRSELQDQWAHQHHDSHAGGVKRQGLLRAERHGSPVRVLRCGRDRDAAAQQVARPIRIVEYSRRRGCLYARRDAKLVNDGERTKIVGLIGVGVTSVPVHSRCRPLHSAIASHRGSGLEVSKGIPAETAKMASRPR